MSKELRPKGKLFIGNFAYFILCLQEASSGSLRNGSPKSCPSRLGAVSCHSLPGGKSPKSRFFGNGTLMPMLPGQKEAAYRLKVYNKVLSEGFYNIEV